MKKALILIALLFIISESNTLCQTYEPTQQNVQKNGSNYLINSTSPEFQINHTFMGWMWVSRPMINSALFVNQMDVWNTDIFKYISKDASLIVKSTIDGGMYCDHGGGANMLMARAMHYKPTLRIPDTNIKLDSIAGACNGNNNNSIFGFHYVNPLGTNNNNGLVLDKTKFTGCTKVLEKPWLIEKLSIANGVYNKDSLNINQNSSIQLYNGNKYFLSLNISNWGILPSNNPVVLKLVMTYCSYDTINKIIIKHPRVVHFEYIPKETITPLTNGRGMVADTIKAAPLQDTVYITRNMIPSGSTPVTLSAFCKFFGQLSEPQVFFDNHRYIDSLNIKVFYVPTCSIKLNWLRIESPNARYLLRGGYDSQILANVSNSLTKFSCSDSAGPNYKNTRYFRENISVETGPQCWAAQRYFNKLVGNIGISVGGTYDEYPLLYEKYVNPPDRWIEMVKFYERVAVPYKRKFTDELEKDKSLGIIAGFKETKKLENGSAVISPVDSLNSGYETYFRYDQNRNAFNALGYQDKLNYISYEDPVNFSSSFQYYWDYMMKIRFYDKNSSGFQYSSKRWWAMNCTLVEYLQAKDDNYYKEAYKRAHHDTVATSFRPYYYFHYYRPLTAEEIRLIDYSQLIMGCIGETYDGALQAVCSDPYNNPPHDTTFRLQLSFQNDKYAEYENRFFNDPTSVNIEEFLLDNKLGGDYLDSVYTFIPRLAHTYYFDPTISDAQKNLSASTYMGIPKERIYAGMRSNRWEIYKIHKWMNENSATLLKLSLVGWKGKGFLSLYNQSSDYLPTDTILKKFVYLDSVKTRKKWQAMPADSGGNYRAVAASHKENKDDQYYDLTLLKSSDYLLNNHFFIGCQSRRSDPLIWLNATNGIPGIPPLPVVYNLQFFSDAEFDVLCDSGGVNPYGYNGMFHYFDKEDWRLFYDKRLGHRILELPIKHDRTQAKPWGYYVKELPYQYPAEGTTEFSNMRYWLRYAYDNEINEFVPYTFTGHPDYDKIDVELLPSAAKILDIERIYKQVAYPEVRWKDTTKINSFDTCAALRSGLGLYFKKVDPTDANNCLYEIYFINKSTDYNFYVPLIADFISDNKKDSIYGIPNSFTARYIKKHDRNEMLWFPKTMLTDTVLIGYYRPNCQQSQVIYKLGFRDCYESNTILLKCGICECCDSVKVDLAPINPLNFCRLNPIPYQRLILQTGEGCKYYGMIVTGGFTPNDNGVLSDLSLPPDSTNQIDLTSYNKWLANPFELIYCGGHCSYCLHFSFLDKSGLEVCNKQYCITIDNSRSPIDIVPSGILSPSCYSIQPAKIAIPSEELHYKQEIIVDPNPTTGSANVKLNLENDLVGRVVLYTNTGELIKEIYNGKLNKGVSNFKIDLFSQPAGMYIITIETDGMSYIKKFVKE